MMKNAEATIAKLIDNQRVAFIGSVDEDGFPNVKAMLMPREREGMRTFYFSTNTSSLRVSRYLKAGRRASIFLYFATVAFSGG